MKVSTPEISWHNRDAILSVNFQKTTDGYKIATGGIEKDIKMWTIILTNSNNVEIKFIANLQRHQTTVNVLRFSPNGEFLASGDSEGIVNVWKQSFSTAPDIFAVQNNNSNSMNATFESSEIWLVQKAFRDHRSDSDVCDLSWSPDSKFLLSCSSDSSLVIWDITLGVRQALIPQNEKRFPVGVAWDPKSAYFISLSNDRVMSVYSVEKFQRSFSVSSAEVPSFVDSSKKLNLKLFHDSSLMSYVRRPCFTPDGNLFIAPAGCIEEDKTTPHYVTYIFTRYNLKKPVVMLPSPKEPTIMVSCCPVAFKLQDEPAVEATFGLPYRFVYAVLTKKSVILYDTQYRQPFAYISNIHYVSLTDCSWSQDGKLLLISSEDGYCSIISFDEQELGNIYDGPMLMDTCATMSDNNCNLETENCAITPKLQNGVEKKKRKIDGAAKRLQPVGDSAAAAVTATPDVIHIEPVALNNHTNNSVNTKTAKGPRRVSFVTIAAAPIGEDIVERAVQRPLASSST